MPASTFSLVSWLTSSDPTNLPLNLQHLLSKTEVKERGVDVHFIADKNQLTSTGSQLPWLFHVAIPVLIDHAPSIAHNKVMIIDDTDVITGSFNFSHAADSRNAENVVLLHNPALAQLYQENWNLRFQESTPYL